jgi:hypothetical protein
LLRGLLATWKTPYSTLYHKLAQAQKCAVFCDVKVTTQNSLTFTLFPSAPLDCKTNHTNSQYGGKKVTFQGFVVFNGGQRQTWPYFASN